MLMMNKTPQYHQKQQGLALISVLFIFALASMLVINMQQRQSLDIAQTTATLALTQAQALAFSAEDIAKAGLVKDMEWDNSKNEIWDTATEQWNQTIAIIEDNDNIDGDINIQVTIRDMQGLFNLNSLMNNHTEAKDRFIRLMDEIGLNQISTAVATELAARLDSTRSPFNVNGAGIPLSHTTELLSLDSMELKYYKILEPFVSALPSSVALNINTAPAEVLASWDPSLSVADARPIINLSHDGNCEINNRGSFVIKTVNDLWGNATLKSKVTNNTLWKQQDFSVNSLYFSVFVQVILNEQVLVLESLIRREKGNVIAVIYRDFSKIPDDITKLNIIKCAKY